MPLPFSVALILISHLNGNETNGASERDTSVFMWFSTAPRCCLNLSPTSFLPASRSGHYPGRKLVWFQHTKMLPGLTQATTGPSPYCPPSARRLRSWRLLSSGNTSRTTTISPLTSSGSGRAFPPLFSFSFSCKSGGLPWGRPGHNRGGARYSRHLWPSVELRPTGKTLCQGHIWEPVDPSYGLPAKNVASSSRQWIHFEACPYRSLNHTGLYTGASPVEHLPRRPSPPAYADDCLYCRHDSRYFVVAITRQLKATKEFGKMCQVSFASERQTNKKKTLYGYLLVSCSYSSRGGTTAVWKRTVVASR